MRIFAFAGENLCINHSPNSNDMEQTECKYNVMTSKDIKVRWITPKTLKAMLSPYMTIEEIERLAKSKKPPFTRKTFRRTYFDGDKVQQYIDKKLKEGAANRS